MATVSVNDNAYLLNGWENGIWLSMTEFVMLVMHSSFHTGDLEITSKMMNN